MACKPSHARNISAMGELEWNLWAAQHSSKLWWSKKNQYPIHNLGLMIRLYISSAEDKLWDTIPMSTFEPQVIVTILKNLPSQAAKKSFEAEWNKVVRPPLKSVRGHLFLTFSAMFCCHTSLSDVGSTSQTTLWPRSTPHVPRTLPCYVGLMYIWCSYVPRSCLCLTADLVAWYCIVRVYTHHLSWLEVSLGLSLRIPPSRWVGPIMYLGLCSFIYFGFPLLAWVISSVLGCPYKRVMGVGAHPCIMIGK